MDNEEDKILEHRNIMSDLEKAVIAERAHEMKDGMTPQEEIRERIAKYLYECDDGIFPDRTVITKWEDAQDSDRQEYYDRADHILKDEDSQGCVLKVDRESLSCGHIGLSVMHGASPICPLLKAGYVAVEPLIEE